MENKTRSDEGKTCRVVITDVPDAIRKMQPKVHGKLPTIELLYRLCSDEESLTRSRIAGQSHP